MKPVNLYSKENKKTSQNALRMFDIERKSEKLCEMKKKGEKSVRSNVVLRLSLQGKAKSGKMFGSPLAPSLRRRHSHHLKKER